LDFKNHKATFKSDYSGNELRIVNCMKQFIAEIWGLIASAKREGVTHREIYQVLGEAGQDAGIGGLVAGHSECQG
jgi:hypothetical protein